MLIFILIPLSHQGLSIVSTFRHLFNKYLLNPYHLSVLSRHWSYVNEEKILCAFTHRSLLLVLLEANPGLYFSLILFLIYEPFAQ